MEKGNNWTTDEVEDMIAIVKEREILSLPEGKKSRSLDTFKVVSDDLRIKGVYRTPEEIRTKLRTLRKDYFKASKSRSKSACRAMPFFPLLHDLFVDAQKKRDAKETAAELNLNQRHPRNQQRHLMPSAASNYHHSRSSALCSVSGSSVSSMQSPQSYHNGYDYQHHHQRHKYTAGVPFVSNCDDSRRHVSPARVIPDKYHLKLNEYQPNLSNSLANLCKNDRYADVFLFVCNDDDNIAIPAHRLVLGTFSSYFASIFEKASVIPPHSITSIVLPPMVTRASIQSLLQYMYTGEAIVPTSMLDDVMLCGELLRIHGFCKKKPPSMLSQKVQPGLVSMPLVSVTKNLSMDPSVVSNPRKRKSTQTPRATPTPTPTPSRSPSPPPSLRVKSPERLLEPGTHKSTTTAPRSDSPASEKLPPTKVAAPALTEKQQAKGPAHQAQSVKIPRREDQGVQTTNVAITKHQAKSDAAANGEMVSNPTAATPETQHPESPPSMPPSPAYSRASQSSLPRPASPVSKPEATKPGPATTKEPAKQSKAPEKKRSPPRDIIDELDNMVTLTSDESMMEIITKSPESQNSPFSTHTNSPIGTNDENGSKLEALIEFDYDELNLPNTSMDDQTCVVMNSESEHQEGGTPLDQLVCSRLNCQLCYESFTTPTDWVQHVSGHCIMDQGLLKRRRISCDDGNSLDSAFRCDMCSSYFISAYDWQSHVAEKHEGV